MQPSEAQVEHDAEALFFAQAYAYRAARQISWLALNGQLGQAVAIDKSFELFFALANFGDYDRIVIRGTFTNAKDYHRGKYIKDNPDCGALVERKICDWF